MMVQVNLCQKLLYFASTNPQYDNRLFIELQVQYMKIPSSNLGRTRCAQKLFLTFKTIFVNNMFSPCSAKRRASDKDLSVLILSFSDSNKRKQLSLLNEIKGLNLDIELYGLHNVLYF